MKKSEIRVGGHYTAKVNDKLVTVRVDNIRSSRSWSTAIDYQTPREQTIYDVTNLTTGRTTTFRSAAKFRSEVPTITLTSDIKRSKREIEKMNEEGEQSLPPSMPVQVEETTAPFVTTKSSPPQMTSKPNPFAAKLARPADDSPHVEVPALAGTGKTTTILGGVCLLKGVKLDLTPSDQQRAVWDAMAVGKSDSIRLSAFNTKITDTLKDRLAQHGLERKGVEARGIHSLGNGAVFKAFGKVIAKDYAVSDRVAQRLGVDHKAAKDDPKLSAIISATDELVGKCKQTLSSPDRDSLDDLASRYDVEMEDVKDQVYDLVPEILEACRTPGELIHFDDMCWLPIVHQLPIFKVDMQIVDEFQDTNRMQQELMFRAGRRIMVVGDMNQAIYGFAGADATAMKTMTDRLTATPKGCIHLPLTMTRRCGRAIVREAQRYVPQFEAHESNVEGRVGRASIDKNSPEHYLRTIDDGDFVLCRVNAPLVSECMRLLVMGRKATILGRKIGEGLVALINKSKASTTVELIVWLGGWLQKEQANEQAKRHPSDTRMETLQDKHDCIVTFCSGLSTVEEVRNKIKSIFTDNKQMHGVTLSSIHKSKGLESRRVYLLEPKGCGPRRDKMQAWELKQEDNLRYVAITRAIEELVYVS